MLDPDTAVIQTTGLSKAYHGRNELMALNLKVPRHSIYGYDSAAIGKRVGYLAQDPRYYDHMTARDGRMLGHETDQ